MDDKTLQLLAEEYGTPLYAYDTARIISQYETLKNSLPDTFGVFYSMKANPLLGICQLFKSLGSSIEVASSGELHTALSAGFRPEDIIFTSPGKTHEELEFAISSGIYSINIESVDEAVIINEVAIQQGKTANISIRINPDFDIAGSSIKMTGVPTQFGIDQVKVEEALKIIEKLPNVNVIGIHIYTGTQALNANNIVLSMEQIIRLALEVIQKCNIELQFLNLGGGFGVPYFKYDTPLVINAFKKDFSVMWEEYREKLSGTRIFVESGRFLMAEAGTYLTKILYKKECKGKKYLVCDGGSNQHASSAFLGRYIRNNFPMHILNKRENEEQVNVVGPLCTPTDLIGQNVLLPMAEPGDILAIDKSGAYGSSQSPVLFLSHPLAAEVQYYKGTSYILRERWGKEAFLKDQRNLNFEL